MGQTLENNLTLLTPKALMRKTARNGKLTLLHKSSYSGYASLKLKHLIDGLYERAQELRKPVKRVIGRGDNEREIEIHDDQALCNVAKVIAALLEQQRIVLRIPSPGRDTPSEAKTIEMPAAAAIDVQEIERLARDAEQVVSETVSEQAASDSGSVSHTDQPS